MTVGVLIGAATFVGMMAGSMFGHLITTAMDHLSSRSRARDAWRKAWRAPR